MDYGLNLGDVIVADFNAGTAWHFHVDNELARIRTREVSSTQERQEQCDHQNNATQDDGCRKTGPFQCSICQTLITLQHSCKTKVEQVDATLKDGRLVIWLAFPLFPGFIGCCVDLTVLLVFDGCILLRFGMDELCTEQRHQRHGEEVGREDGENNSIGQVGEDVLAYASQNEDRKENDRGGYGCSEDRKSNLSSAVTCGNFGRSPFLHKAKDVLKHDDGIINQAR